MIAGDAGGRRRHAAGRDQITRALFPSTESAAPQSRASNIAHNIIIIHIMYILTCYYCITQSRDGPLKTTTIRATADTYRREHIIYELLVYF